MPNVSESQRQAISLVLVVIDDFPSMKNIEKLFDNLNIIHLEDALNIADSMLINNINYKNNKYLAVL